MRKNVMTAGVLAVIIGVVFMALAIPLLSNFTAAGIRSSGGGEYSSPSFALVSSDTVTVESQAPVYMVSSSAVNDVSRSSVSNYAVAPVADNSIAGLTTETWNGLSGNYSLVSFNSSSISARISITTPSSFNSIFGYSIAVGLGAILFLTGIGMFFVGLVLRKKVLPDDFTQTDDTLPPYVEDVEASPLDVDRHSEYKKS